MKKLSVIVIFFVFMMSCSSTTDITEIYVSQNEVANANGSKDAPFSNISEAIKKANEIKSANTEAKVVINILPGTYRLSEAIKIPASLSGLTIKGAGASEVSIKGSQVLEAKWKTFSNNIFVTDIPAGLDFDQFLVNGKPQILARYPNYDESAQYWQGYAADAISKERVATWANPEGAIFNALHNGRWGGFHFEITGVNDDGTPVLSGGQQNNRGSKPHEEYRMVENVFEELDSAGEWFLDKKRNKLFYWPESISAINDLNLEVSVLKDLIQVVGTLENPVKDVTISGIKFENTTRTFMEDFEPLLRSDWTIYRGAVVFFEGTENCKVEHSEFTNLGGNVIMASKYNKGLEI